MTRDEPQSELAVLAEHLGLTLRQVRCVIRWVSSLSPMKRASLFAMYSRPESEEVP